MTISVGDRLPEATFGVIGPNGPDKKTTDDVFAGRRVVLFGVPGPFTPTCHLNHLPGYLENRDAILEKGVDEIAVVAVSDMFVMDAWADSCGARNRILFLADGNGDFARATGLDVDMTERGFGTRFRRFSMSVEDGVVRSLNIEETPREATLSGAARMLESL